MFQGIRYLAAAFCAACAFFGATGAGAVTITPFATPIGADETTAGSASAVAFEDFSMSSLTAFASDDLLMEMTFQIDPYTLDLLGAPAFPLVMSYSVNGGAQAGLPITPAALPMGTAGEGGLSINLAAGDFISFIIDGAAGPGGYIVSFNLETFAPTMSEVPLPAALPLFLGGVACLRILRRRA